MRTNALIAIALSFGSQTGDEVALDPGSYELRLEGELSGHEIGAARFTNEGTLDGEDAFVVQLITPVLEGGVFLVFHGPDLPVVGPYEPVRVPTKGMGGYERVELSRGQVAVLYYEMEREHMVLLGATGRGRSVDVSASADGGVRGRFDVEVTGATGNPSAFLSVRKRTGRITGVFAAARGDVEFRKP